MKQMKQRIWQRPCKVLGVVCLSAASTIFAGMFTPAGAQSQSPPSPYSPPDASPSPPSQPSPQSPPAALGPVGQLVQFGNSLGKTLADAGVYLSGSYTEDLSSLVSGGLKTGTIPTGEFSLGATFDLQKILGIPQCALCRAGGGFERSKKADERDNRRGAQY